MPALAAFPVLASKGVPTKTVGFPVNAPILNLLMVKIERLDAITSRTKLISEKATGSVVTLLQMIIPSGRAIPMALN